MGYLITFEGVEGSGKTTQIKRLEKRLVKAGRPCIMTREPGGSPVGDEIRKVLLSSETVELTPLGELFLYEAARVQHVTQVISPALTEGKVVLCDRFIDATTAYQGYARQLDLKMVEDLNRLGSLGVTPNLTLLLDCPVEVGLGRASERIKARKAGLKEDRFERESIAFHHRVREGYLKIARDNPERVVVIDASLAEDEAHETICYVVDERLQQALGKA
jgi:dTMP kinase